MRCDPSKGREYLSPVQTADTLADEQRRAKKFTSATVNVARRDADVPVSVRCFGRDTEMRKPVAERKLAAAFTAIDAWR